MPKQTPKEIAKTIGVEFNDHLKECILNVDKNGHTFDMQIWREYYALCGKNQRYNTMLGKALVQHPDCPKEIVGYFLSDVSTPTPVIIECFKKDCVDELYKRSIVNILELKPGIIPALKREYAAAKAANSMPFNKTVCEIIGDTIEPTQMESLHIEFASAETVDKICMNAEMAIEKRLDAVRSQRQSRNSIYDRAVIISKGFAHYAAPQKRDKTYDTRKIFTAIVNNPNASNFTKTTALTYAMFNKIKALPENAESQLIAASIDELFHKTPPLDLIKKEDFKSDKEFQEQKRYTQYLWNLNREFALSRVKALLENNALTTPKLEVELMKAALSPKTGSTASTKDVLTRIIKTTSNPDVLSELLTNKKFMNRVDVSEVLSNPNITPEYIDRLILATIKVKFKRISSSKAAISSEELLKLYNAKTTNVDQEVAGVQESVCQLLQTMIEKNDAWGQFRIIEAARAVASSPYSSDETLQKMQAIFDKNRKEDVWYNTPNSMWRDRLLPQLTKALKDARIPNEEIQAIMGVISHDFGSRTSQNLENHIGRNAGQVTSTKALDVILDVINNKIRPKAKEEALIETIDAIEKGFDAAHFSYLKRMTHPNLYTIVQGKKEEPRIVINLDKIMAMSPEQRRAEFAEHRDKEMLKEDIIAAVKERYAAGSHDPEKDNELKFYRTIDTFAEMLNEVDIARKGERVSTAPEMNGVVSTLLGHEDVELF